MGRPFSRRKCLEKLQAGGVGRNKRNNATDSELSICALLARHPAMMVVNPPAPLRNGLLGYSEPKEGIELFPLNTRELSLEEIPGTTYDQPAQLQYIRNMSPPKLTPHTRFPPPPLPYPYPTILTSGPPASRVTYIMDDSIQLSCANKFSG